MFKVWVELLHLAYWTISQIRVGTSMYVCVLYADFLTIIALILFRKRLSSNEANIYVYQKGKILSSKIVLDSLY